MKDVPVFYLPAFYYPINKEDRATGFLMPIYGASTIRGQSLSNAFFWAINRSQDATFYHDWFSKTGQGVRRRVPLHASAAASTATSRLLHARTSTRPTTSRPTARTTTHPAATSYQMQRQRCRRRCGARLHARAQRQLLLEPRDPAALPAEHLQTRPTARGPFGGNVDRQLGRQHRSAAPSTATRSFYERRQTRPSPAALPRIIVQPRRAADRQSPIYFGVNTEYVTLIRNDGAGRRRSDDRGLTRIDVIPTVRFPFTKWPFLTVNSSVGWREHLLDREPRRQPASRCRTASTASTSTCRRASPARSSTGSSTRRTAATPEVQARDRADVHRSSASPRSTTSTRSCKLDGTRLRRRRRHDALTYGLEQPALRQEGDLARDRQRRRSRRATTPTPRRRSTTAATRAATTRQPTPTQLLAGRAAGPACRPTDRVQTRLPRPSTTPRCTRSRTLAANGGLQRAAASSCQAAGATGAIPELPGYDNPALRQPLPQRAPRRSAARATALGGIYIVQLRHRGTRLPAAAHHRRSTTRSAAASAIEYQTYNYSGG